MYDLAPVQIAYSDWLAKFNWQWFCTLTFKDPPHPERAEKTFRYWIHRINQGLYGRRYFKRQEGVYWVLAMEYHKSGVIHFHALLADVEDLNTRFSRSAARNLWFDLAGIGRVDPIDDRLQALTDYVSKYVTKGGELTVGPGLEHYATQLSTEAAR